MPKSIKQRCRVCGCTWDNACPGGCYWVEDDLCSRCAEKRGGVGMNRYYLTQRPPAPGTFPGKPVNLETFDTRKHVDEIGRLAWGWVEYRKPLSEKQADEYELTRAKEPFYKVEPKTQSIIIQLKKKSVELGLGNVSFHYFPTKTTQDDTDFYLTEYKRYWELVVKQRWAKTIDVYRIEEDSLKYLYSEND